MDNRTMNAATRRKQMHDAVKANILAQKVQDAIDETEQLANELGLVPTPQQANEPMIPLSRVAEVLRAAGVVSPVPVCPYCKRGFLETLQGVDFCPNCHKRHEFGSGLIYINRADVTHALGIEL